jgi:ATP-binding cassette, subfamily C (CFTR/MRP), member 10
MDYNPLASGTELHARYKKLRSLRGNGKLIAAESEEVVKVERKTYSRLMEAWGGWKIVIMVNVSMCCFMFTSIYNNNLLLSWADKPHQQQQDEFNRYAIFLFSFGLLTAVFIFIRISLLVWGNLRATSILHNELLNKVLQAPINLYYDVTPIGQILNRFSKDLMILDSSIVFAISGFTGCFYNAMSSLIVAVYVVPYIIFAVICMLIIAVLIFRYCLEGYN